MGQTPNYQLPYPEGLNPVHEGAKNMRDLATRVDTVLAGLAARVPASLASYATRAWVTTQGFASQALTSAMIRGDTGGGVMRGDARIVAGSHVGTPGFNVLDVPVPAGWNPAGWVFAGLATNGDAAAKRFVASVYALPPQNVQTATTFRVLCDPLDGSSITTPVRVNWLLVGA